MSLCIFDEAKVGVSSGGSVLTSARCKFFILAIEEKRCSPPPFVAQRQRQQKMSDFQSWGFCHIGTFAAAIFLKKVAAQLGTAPASVN